MFTGGICGVFILMIFPAYLVATSRKKTGITSPFTHQALLKHWVIPYLFIAFGFASLIFNLVETVLRLTKKK